MATIKSYSDLQQSKKLAGILPIESADMFYDRGGLPSFIDKYVTHESIKNDKYQHLIPCWSLAALLRIIGHYTLQTVSKGKKVFIISEKYPICSEDYSEPVDACVDMIEKLHELNLL